jgi:serine/threonine-protein kinase
MAVRFVPGGPFLMGNPEDASDGLPHEQPQHRVELDPFWLDQTEVSNAQYRRCVEAEACQPPVVNTFFDDESYAQHPVVYVTWDQATAYCGWLAQETGWPVALPSEAQWEKAAAWDPQLEGHRRYPWGEEAPTPDLANLNVSGLGRTAPVDSYPAGASAYGPRNLAGNVWEWVADWYQPDYYSTAPSSNPSGPESGSRRVIRGGGYGHGTAQARTAHRDSAGPTASGNALGFRCAINAEDLP